MATFKHCLHCEKKFKTYLSKLKLGRGKYCSKKCKNLGQMYMYSPICGDCGKIVSTYQTRFCRSCKQKGERNHMYGKFGKNNHNWKGGWIMENGYKAITVKGKQLLEHRHLFEKTTGRKLKKDDVIHHRDGNRLNNTLANLVLMSNSEHARLHASSEEMSKRGKLGAKARWHI